MCSKARKKAEKPGKSRKKDKVKTLMKKDVEWVCSELKEMDVDQTEAKVVEKSTSEIIQGAWYLCPIVAAQSDAMCQGARCQGTFQNNSLYI